ncbi:hypothetical protein PG985_001535 [Apiospora marii]|uniref:Uncharacterized protein n=1 Tax=Apiospora marii TaxID=335849 RepID=A0ABR1RI73_9PEZI
MQLPRVRPSSPREAAAPPPRTNPERRKDETPRAAAHNESDNTNLRDPQNSQHLAVFADALFRSLPSNLDLRGFDGIAAAIEQTIKTYSFTVAARDGDGEGEGEGEEDPLTEATCRRLGYLMYRHRRRVVAIIRQRYVDAEAEARLEGLLQSRGVAADLREDGVVERGDETGPSDVD